MTLDEIYERTVEDAGKCVAEGGIRPRVAALVMKDQELLGASFRGQSGKGDHAEFALLEKSSIDPTKFVGATVYTTLEPCTVRGPNKTPCARRLADAKVAKVVIGMIDPNPTIRGGGVEMLRDAGIEVELYPTKYMAKLEALNADFTRAQRALRATLGNPVLDELALGVQLHASGQYRQSTGHLEIALANTARWLASSLLNTDSDFQRMAAAAELAIAYDGTNYDQFFTAGYAQFKLGNHSNAEKHLREAVRLLNAHRNRLENIAGVQERWAQALGLIHHLASLRGEPDGSIGNQYREALSRARGLGGMPQPLGPWERELGF